MFLLVLSCHITVLKNNSNLSELLRAKEEFGLICFLLFKKKPESRGCISRFSPRSDLTKRPGALGQVFPHRNEVKMFQKSEVRFGSQFTLGHLARETKSGMRSGELEYTVGPHEQLVRVSDVRREKNKHKEGFKDQAYLFH